MALQYPGMSLGARPRWGGPGGVQPTQTSNPMGDSYKLYNTAVEQQAKDYGDIMGKYNTYFNNSMDPSKFAYEQSQDSKDSLGILKGYAQNGGYSDNDIYALRERGISPIRSIYAGANRDIDRGRALQGGFSPNYAATKAKMAREMSSQISDQMNNVNAGIAQNVATNKLGAASSYAGNANAENSTRNQMKNQNLNYMGDALRGMTSLYGTTPALAQLFGSQALQGSSLQNDINQSNTRNNLALISSLVSGLN